MLFSLEDILQIAPFFWCSWYAFSLGNTAEIVSNFRINLGCWEPAHPFFQLFQNN